MPAIAEISLDRAWDAKPALSTSRDRISTDGSHAWLGLMLMLFSSIVAIRGLCWIAASVIRAFH